MFSRNFLQLFHPNTAPLAVQHWNKNPQLFPLWSLSPLAGPGTQSSLLSGRGHSSESGQQGQSLRVGLPEHQSFFCDLHLLTWPGRAIWTPLMILLSPDFRRIAKTPGSWHLHAALHAPHVNAVMLERLFLSEAPLPGRARTMEQKTELDLRQVPVCSNTAFIILANDDYSPNHTWHLIR